MSDYKAPIRDIEFTANELMGFLRHYAALDGKEEITEETLSAILTAAAKFCENRLNQLNRIGDRHGCEWGHGHVRTPPGFKQAFEDFAEGGWLSLAADPKRGGQGLPFSLFMLVFEMVASSNMAWSLYIVNYYGALITLERFGTDEQKARYIAPLITGEWNATMCLTEPHCGSDLGLLTTRAEPNPNGSFSIYGTKIFITGGEHDLNVNIVHLVLARISEAPAGTKGISLFIVPKFDTAAGVMLGERNRVYCTAIENKMGIHASATCTMVFDGATGYLLGEANKGLEAMFTHMNESRVTAAVQAYAPGEAAFQAALGYAKQRLQMRTPRRTNPEQPADPIIAHPDVRRMLFTQKALNEGGRMLSYYCLQQMDIALNGSSEKAKKTAEDRLALLTPIAKGFNSEVGVETTSLALQIYGGHGYITETGVEQYSRDQRITAIYEGVTVIQGLDLLGRKVLGLNLLDPFLTEMEEFITRELEIKMNEFSGPLSGIVDGWRDITSCIRDKAKNDPDLVGACAYDYLMYSGYALLAYWWAQASIVSCNQLAKSDDAFYTNKLATARFYYRRILPRSQYHAQSLRDGSGSLMELGIDIF